MKRIKRLLLTMLLIATMSLLIGCGSGSTVNTALTLEKDLSGSRQMEIIFTQSNFEQYFSGSQDDLNNVISNFCPANMTWSYETIASDYKYLFKIDFTSVDDYSTKVKGILGEEASVVISSPDSVWVNGIYVEESFSSTDLLAWLSDAIINGGLVDSSHASNLFGNGDTKVFYNGEENATSKQILLDKIEYQDIELIEILTKVNEIGSYDRKVAFYVEEESMEQKGDEIREYMKSVTPSAGELEEETIDGKIVLRISGSNLAVSDLELFMKSVFGEDHAAIVSENVDDNFSPFVFSEYWSEKIHLDNYVIGDSSTRCVYLSQNSDTYNTYSTENFDNLLNEGLGVSENNIDNTILKEIYYYGDDVQGISFPLLVQKEYNANNMTVDSGRDLFGDWERVTEVSFNTVPSENEIEIIMSKLNGLVDVKIEDEADEIKEDQETGDQDEISYGKVKIKNKVDDEEWLVTVTQKGTGQELENSSEALLGSSGRVTYAREKGFYKIKKTEAYSEQVNYSKFLGNVNDEFTIKYKLDLGLGAKADYSNYDNPEYLLAVKGGKLSVENLGSSIDMKYAGSCFDLLAIGFWVSVIGALVLIALVSLKLGLLEKIKSLSKKKTTGDFCGNCGAGRENEDEFCAGCGQRFEK